MLLSGCAGEGGAAARAHMARLAAQGGFRPLTIDATPFHLAAFLRLSAPSSVLRVYIEGDGHAWDTLTRPSNDPTPWSPVALELAVHDPAPNVAYLARPCQYVPLGTDAACTQAAWTDARYSPVVIASTNQALDRLKAMAGARELELVGFSGGGAVAVLAAAQRHDVRNLRTVAADLDTALWTREHDVSPLAGSLNPVSVAAAVADVPQVHFVGTADRIVDASVVRSYAAAAGDAACLHIVPVPDMEHDGAWIEWWPRLLRAYRPDAPQCKQK
jgi:hypothetical protein